jgi:hypothetical protein
MSFNSEFGQTGKYMEFYKAIKLMHPDIQMISNCDGSSASLDPAFEASAWHRANLEIVILKTIFRQVSSCTLSCLFFSNFASVCALLLLMKIRSPGYYGALERVLLSVQEDLQGLCNMSWIGFGVQGDVDFVQMLNGIRTGEHPAALAVIV